MLPTGRPSYPYTVFSNSKSTGVATSSASSAENQRPDLLLKFDNIIRMIEIKPEVAFFLFFELANEGDVEASYHCGLMFIEGKGVEENSDQGMHYLKYASEKGHELAKAKLLELEREPTCVVPSHDWEFVLTRDLRANIVRNLEPNGLAAMASVNKDFRELFSVASVDATASIRRNSKSRARTEYTFESLYDEDFSVKKIFEIDGYFSVFFDGKSLSLFHFRNQHHGETYKLSSMQKAIQAVSIQPTREGEPEETEITRLIQQFPTFLPTNQIQERYKAMRNDMNALGLPKELQKHVFTQYCTNPLYASEIDRAVAYDAFGKDSVIHGIEILALEAAIASEKAQLSQPVFVYLKLSGADIFTMKQLKTFTIPSFVCAYTDEFGQEGMQCPIQPMVKNDDRGVNVILEITVPEANGINVRRVAGDNNSSQVIFSCYSHFKFVKTSFQKGDKLLRVSIEAVTTPVGEVQLDVETHKDFLTKRHDAPFEQLSAKYLLERVEWLDDRYQANIGHQTASP